MLRSFFAAWRLCSIATSNIASSSSVVRYRKSFESRGEETDKSFSATDDSHRTGWRETTVESSPGIATCVSARLNWAIGVEGGGKNLKDK
ncbi:hypothetical protein BO83DRAFT_16422 [Aspergillus eucalypticola CBS 122712]|uniref:Uncharacterized protein n=1 Tax=Aspergillus eucalypticola (strain CBS 122712 / IBT 29274) TaxID=1448314 RepID=A0A317VKD4_ASPEC|nr:uncharacterized protein BO83DRAFT_16422 [Aspergillus eucalypticola CBS 122712]PWY74814.1 hypothetical protein BO83DRAFT_16422 [Aspergillus eucalypticola CBS 122712]